MCVCVCLSINRKFLWILLMWLMRKICILGIKWVFDSIRDMKLIEARKIFIFGVYSNIHFDI